MSDVVVVDDPEAPWLLEWTETVHAVGAGKSTFGYSRELDRWLDENIRSYDVVIVHSIWMYFSWAIWKAARNYSVPYYLFVHGALDPWFGRYFWKQVKKAIYWRLVEHKVLRDAEAVLFTTEEEKNLAKGAFSPYECNAVTVGLGIQEPPDPPRSLERTWREEATATFPALTDRKMLLFLGRIHEKKGVDLLLRAFAILKSKYTDTALVIAGPGDKKTLDKLRRLAVSLGIEGSVVWTGPLYGPAKWSAIRSADAYILPSHQENFGISIVEAMACGTPVLISDKVNIWREVHSEDGGLVASDDLQGALNLLRSWSELSLNRKQQMRANARRCFSKHFDVASSSSKLFELLRSSRSVSDRPVLSDVV